LAASSEVEYVIFWCLDPSRTNPVPGSVFNVGGLSEREAGIFSARRSGDAKPSLRAVVA
jgi:hypothetical protein